MSTDPRPAPPSSLDLELLRFAAEHRFVLAAQLARLVDRSLPSVQRTLSRLGAAGLLKSERPLRHEPAAYRVTGKGLAAAGSDLRAPRPIDLAEYRHDVGLGWLHVAARRGRFGEVGEVVSERRMRSEDRRADRPPDAPRHGVALWPGRGPRLHYPDLALVTAGGHRVAFELELSTKAPAHRERILAAYASDLRIDAVVYLVPTRAAGEAILRSATRAGARDKLRVQRFAWADGRAPGEPPRAMRRSAATRQRAAETGVQR